MQLPNDKYWANVINVSHDTPILFLFGGASCRPCGVLKTIMDNDTSWHEEFAFVYVDVYNDGAAAALAAMLKVVGLPALTVLTNGEFITDKVGWCTSPGQWHTWINTTRMLLFGTGIATVPRPLVPPQPIAITNKPALKHVDAKQQGFTGDSCSNCNSMRVIRNGSCTVCTECGTTTGCS